MLIPSVIENKNNKEYLCDIYSKLLNDRIIFLNGQINEITANNIIAQLLYLDSINTNDIYLYINSPGGEVTSGLAIYDTMKYIKSDVRTIAVGLAASMGALILSSGTKGKRCSLKNSEIMIHEPLGGSSGRASDIKINTDQIIKIKKNLNKILSDNTGKSIKKIEKDTEKDYYLTATEALNYGLIDLII